MSGATWPLISLNEACSLVTDGTHHSPQNGPSGDYMYVTAKNIRPHGLDLSDITFIDQETHNEIYARCPVEYGDILYIKDGATTGLAVVNHIQEPFSLLSSVALLKPRKDLVDSLYLKHWLNAPSTFETLTGQMTGSAIKRLVLRQIRQAEVPLPSLPEQRRIVKKIEALTARSRLAREALDSLPALIDRYRQSVLASAFRGDLTADWRTIGAASEGKLPGGWSWKTVTEIIDEGPTNGYSPKAAPDGNGTASLRLSATTSGRMIMNDTTIKRLVETIQEDSKFWLRNGDILIQRANSLEYLGATAIYEGEEKNSVYPDLMMRVRITDPSLRIYFWRYMNSRAARHWLRERATGTAGNMPKISGATLKDLPVPVPPPNERVVINRRIDQAFAAIDRIKLNHLETESRLATLDQSILAKAFRGELVPQDPNDEPASVLLERIRAERAAAGAPPRRGRRVRT